MGRYAKMLGLFAVCAVLGAGAWYVTHDRIVAEVAGRQVRYSEIACPDDLPAGTLPPEAPLSAKQVRIIREKIAILHILDTALHARLCTDYAVTIGESEIRAEYDRMTAGVPPEATQRLKAYVSALQSATRRYTEKPEDESAILADLAPFGITKSTWEAHKQYVTRSPQAYAWLMQAGADFYRDSAARLRKALEYKRLKEIAITESDDPGRAPDALWEEWLAKKKCLYRYELKAPYDNTAYDPALFNAWTTQQLSRQIMAEKGILSAPPAHATPEPKGN